MRYFVGDPLAAVCLIFSAWLLGMSFQAPSLTPLAWLALVAIGVLVRQAAIIPAYAAGVVFQLTGAFWMTQCYSNPELTETRVINWLLLGIYFGAIFPIILALGRRLADRWPMWVLLPVIWTIGDLLRYETGRLIGGPYPWLALGYSQTGFIPICQVADLGGAWAVGFMVAMLGGLLADSIQRRFAIIPAILILAAVGYGYARMWTIENARGPTVVLMPGGETEVPDADLALWPESAFFGYPQVTASCPTVEGCIRVDGERTFNSAVIDIHGEVICYDKCNLVPYSESKFTAGTEIVSFDLDGCQIGVAICYDICFASFMCRLNGCNLVLVPANEASDPTMGLAWQLLAMGKLRAIELRRTIIRNANGGYSGAIDGNGDLHPVELDFRTAVKLEPAELDSRFSLYAQVGDWLPIACVLAVVLTVCRRPRLQSVPLVPGDVIEDESNGPVAQ